MSPRVTFLKAAGVFTAFHTASAETESGLERSTIVMPQECELSSLLSTRIFLDRHIPLMTSSPRKSPSQERSRQTVERILDAAARIFHEQGYAGATTKDIAYQYFPNKDALLAALTKRHITTTTSSLAVMIGKLPEDSGFDVILRAVVRFLVEQHDLDDLHLLVMHTAPRTHEINLELEQAKTQLVEIASVLLAKMNIIEDQQMLIARMVVATIDAAVHDVIIRQPRGKKRQAAIDLTISTALSIIETAAARE
jgi:AcrR family transcriptional regulator